VASTIDTSAAAPAGDPPRPPRRVTVGRVVVVVLVAGMLAMWGYVAYLAFGPGRADPPDRVDDPAFAVAAEARCRQALADVAQLPPASATPEPAPRAEVLEAANATFAAMLDDLDLLVPAGDDGRIVELWLEDWRTYLGDREDYAARLRTEGDTRLYVTEGPGGRHITTQIDHFAEDNDIPACSTPLDV
jgi:hypothetical protein